MSYTQLLQLDELKLEKTTGEQQGKTACCCCCGWFRIQALRLRTFLLHLQFKMQIIICVLGVLTANKHKIFNIVTNLYCGSPYCEHYQHCCAVGSWQTFLFCLSKQIWCKIARIIQTGVHALAIHLDKEHLLIQF